MKKIEFKSWAAKFIEMWPWIRKQDRRFTDRIEYTQADFQFRGL